MPVPVSSTRLAAALLAAALLSTTMPAHALDCAPKDDAASVKAAFEREFERQTGESRQSGEMHTQAIDALVASFDAKQAWTEEERVHVLMSIQDSVEFSTEESLKADLKAQMEPHLRVLESGTGDDLCTHAQTLLALYAEGLSSNERQWRFMRETLAAREAAAKPR